MLGLLGVLATPALACGGFFCEPPSTEYTVPVLQSSERILFLVDEEAETTTTFVEVAYQQSEEVDFAWVIPIPEPINAEDVATTDAELFNALEQLTAPQFTFQYLQNGNYGGYPTSSFADSGSRGCGCGLESSVSADDSSFAANEQVDTEPLGEETVSVEVVAEAVVGPFAIEVITATDALDFAEWLATNGYDLPEGAIDPLQYYVDMNMAYLGVKLAPEGVPEGPIDTLVFTYGGTEPMIPIVLTAIASTDDLGIIAYVASAEPYGPDNWDVLEDLAPDTLPNGQGGSNYLPRFRAASDAFEGKAFALEYANETAVLPRVGDPVLDVLGDSAWLTRWRAELSPSEMTSDPVFTADPELQPYNNLHVIQLDFGYGSTPASARLHPFAVVLPLLMLGVAWARNRGGAPA